MAIARVRQAQPSDRIELAKMRTLLWPDAIPEEHLKELDDALHNRMAGTLPAGDSGFPGRGWDVDRLPRSWTAISRRRVQSRTTSWIRGRLVRSRGVPKSRGGYRVDACGGRLGSFSGLHRNGVGRINR